MNTDQQVLSRYMSEIGKKGGREGFLLAVKLFR